MDMLLLLHVVRASDCLQLRNVTSITIVSWELTAVGTKVMHQDGINVDLKKCGQAGVARLYQSVPFDLKFCR